MFWLAKLISTLVYLFVYLLFLFLPVEELKLFKKGCQMRKSAVIKINSKKSSPKMEP